MPETTPHPSRFDDDDPLVARVRGLCARYPEVAEVVAHGRPTWRAGTRQFAIVGAAHQPEDAVVVRVDPDERGALLERDDVWVPAYEGATGYLAISAGPGDDWTLIEELIDSAYRLVANQRQLRALDADPVVPLEGEPHMDRSRFTLVFEDDFDGDDIDTSKWIPAYLPQWSSRAATRPRYSLGGGVLTLRIDEDQRPWSPEFDGGSTWVSNLQTAVRSGPIGSSDGQHRMPGFVVREEQEREVLFAPSGGLIEVRMRATRDPDAMAALWLIGVEDRPNESGEVCVAEIFGRDIRGDVMQVGIGVHPHHDPDLADDFTTVEVTGADDFHEYAAEWSSAGARFYVDGVLVREVAQAPGYPLMLMLDLYAFGRPDGGRGTLPKSCEVDWVRGWALAPD